MGVDAALTEEQQLLFETATRLGGQSSGLKHEIREENWSEIRKAGLDALRQRDEGVPQASGVEVGLVAEAFGASLVALPFLGVTLAAELIGLAGECANGFVPVPLLVPTLAAVSVPAGQAPAIAWDAFGATHGVTLRPLASGRAEVCIHELDDGLPSIPSADATRALWRVDLADHSSIGEIDRDAITRWEAFALSMVSCELIGVMDAALQRALVHASNRTQFERVVASFQAVQHICADQYVSLAAARSCARFASWAVDHAAPNEALMAARVAKVYCGQAALELVEASIQVHGGIGMTWECDVHHFLRRVLLDRRTLGSDDVHLDRIADARMKGS